MFGFRVKKEYIYEKINNFIETNQNISESFDELLNKYFHIQFLNRFEKNLIIPELQREIVTLNYYSECDKNIMCCLTNNHTLAIGYVTKESVYDDFRKLNIYFNYDDGSDNTEIISHIEEVKEFIGLENIENNELCNLEIDMFYDTLKYAFIPTWDPSKSLGYKCIYDYYNQINEIIPDDFIQHIETGKQICKTFYKKFDKK